MKNQPIQLFTKHLIFPLLLVQMKPNIIFPGTHLKQHEPSVIQYAKVTDGNTKEFPEENANTVKATLAEASPGIFCK